MKTCEMVICPCPWKQYSLSYQDKLVSHLRIHGDKDGNVSCFFLDVFSRTERFVLQDSLSVLYIGASVFSESLHICILIVMVSRGPSGIF